MASFSVAGKVQLNARSATLTLQLPEEEPEVKIYRPKSDASMEDIEAGRIQSIQAANQWTRKSSAMQWTTCSACYFSREEQKKENGILVRRCDWNLSSPSLLWSRTWNCPLATISLMLKMHLWKMAIQTHHRISPQIPIHLPARLKKMPLWRIPWNHPTRTRKRPCYVSAALLGWDFWL